MNNRIMFPSASRWSETEMDVAETLRDLYRVCLLTSVPFSWTCKRKRSSIQNNTPLSLNKRLCTFNGGSVFHKGETSSPAIPLSFPTTQSNEKIKHSKSKTSLEKKKESLLKSMEDLKKTETSLKRLNHEIENSKKQYDEPKNFKLVLKIRKQEFGNPNLKIGEKVQDDQFNDGLIKNLKSTAENEEQQKKEQQHQLQQIQKQMLPNHQNQINGLSSIGLGRNINSNNNGPIALPDLNLSMEDIIANRRVIAAAQARRRRLHIIRVKKNRK